MKTVIVLTVLALVLVQTVESASSCTLKKHLALYAINYNSAQLYFPCKYKLISQTCGEYEVTITAQNVYTASYFVTDNFWIRVQRGNELWEGLTNNQLSIEFLRGDIGEPFTKNGGNLETSQLFTFAEILDANNTDETEAYGYYTAWAEGIAFRFMYRPFFESQADRGVTVNFYCNRNDTPPAFPAQLCGGKSTTDLEDEANRLGFVTNDKYNGIAGDKTIYYYVFTDSTVDQAPEKTCGAVVNTMNNVCANDAKRVQAINLCHKILYSSEHRTCVSENAKRKSKELIDVFYQCAEFVCRGFTSLTACKTLGDYIDACPVIPGLTDKVGQCS